MNEPNNEIPERPDAFWNRVYVAVLITTTVVISLLYGFTKYFSH